MERWFGRSEGVGSLSDQQRSFLEALEDVLDRVQPSTINRTESEIKPYHRGVHIAIAHRSGPDYSLLLDVADDEVTVSFGSEHEHFSRNDAEMGRVWPFDQGDFLATALFFVEQLLTGRVRVEVLKRPLQVKTRSYWINDEGVPELFMRGGTVLPVLGWSRSPRIEQISFI